MLYRGNSTKQKNPKYYSQRGMCMQENDPLTKIWLRLYSTIVYINNFFKKRLLISTFPCHTLFICA